MLEIVPAILEKDFDELSRKIELVHTGARMIQIDVCDGKFLPSISWPFSAPNVLSYDPAWRSIVAEEEGMPYWDAVDFELDLMIMHELEKIDALLKLGPSRIVIHPNYADTHAFFHELRKRIGGDIEIGIALHQSAQAESVFEYIDDGDVSFVQCMGIRKVGFQGQSFDDKVLENIRALRARYKDLPISVDGGVNLGNAPALIDAGATRLVIGSAIFGSENPALEIEKFKEIE